MMNDISEPNSQPHILYSFRRCPYAMRARMALVKAAIEPELREVVLRNKPAEMLKASPKGSVPVLVLNDGTVIDESRDIMVWALTQNDPDGWLAPTQEEINTLITHNDDVFKKSLDRYKYPNRYPDEDCSSARDSCLQTFMDYEQRLENNNGYLLSAQLSMADIAIFPFIRQCAFVDKDWFDALPVPHLHKWLRDRLESTLFAAIMQKEVPWETGQSPIYLKAA